MFWLIVTGVLGLIVGWGLCAMLGAGKISDLEFEIMLERRNKEHWKSKVKEQ